MPTHQMGFLYGNDYTTARTVVYRTCELGQNFFSSLPLTSINQKLALVWAVSHITLRQILSDVVDPSWRVSIMTGINSVAHLLSPTLRLLLETLATNRLGINHNHSMRHIYVFQLLIHIAALAITSNNHSYMSQLAISTTRKLQEQFFPTMPENIENVLAGIYAGMQITTLYRCVCGEAYGIGNCGMFNERGRCATCGRAIGSDGALQAFGQTTQPIGYQDNPIEETGHGHRQLDVATLRTLRVIIHGCMFASRLLSLDPTYTRHSLEALINKVESDVRTVQDNLRINEEFSFESLHCLLYNVTQQGALPNNNFPTSDSRNVWEGNFARFIGGQRHRGMNELHREVLHRIDQDAGEESLIMNEIRGTYNPDPELNIPSILTTNFPSTNVLADFSSFMNSPDHIQNYPIVYNLFFKLVVEDIAILRELPKVILFSFHIIQAFGGQITLNEAQTTPIRALLVNHPSLMKRFEVVCRVWNHVRTRVNRFECEAVDIPTLSSESPTITVINHPSHGKIMLEIISAVLQIQNSTLQEIYNTIKTSPENRTTAASLLVAREDAADIDICVPFSAERFSSESMYLIGAPDFQHALNSLLEKTYSCSSGNFSWPLDYIQSVYLLEFILGRPYLTAKSLPVFQFAYTVSHRVYSKDELNAIVTQVDLSSATKQLIQNELYSAEIANDTLSQLKATIEVIQRIGGHQGNNMLEFMKIMRMQVLLPNVFKHCTFSNFHSLQTLLVAKVKPDTIEAVSAQYKEPMMDAQVKAIRASQVNTKLLLETVREFVQTKLTSDEAPIPSSSLKHWLAYTPPLVDDELEVRKLEVTFPESILVAHSCALIVRLQEAIAK